MAIPYLVFTGICAIFMLCVIGVFFMAAVAIIAKLISIIANIDEDSAMRVTVVLLGIVLTALSIMSRV